MTTLKQGSRGSDVTNLQNALKSAGYNVGSVDGIFGPKTLSAVKSYQTAKGLKADGIVGTKTWGALGAKTTTNPTSQTNNNKLVAPTIPRIDPFKPDEKNKPELPTIEQPPQADEFKPNIDMSELTDQSLELLKPQYERGKEKLQDLYTQNVQHINDEALKRGIARGSYVGNRQDEETTQHGKRLGDLERDYNEQANLMATQNYDKEWNRQYQLHRDTTEDTWRRYNADVDTAWKKYGALMDVYKLDLDNQRTNYTTGVDNSWKTYQAGYGQYRDAMTDKQRQEEFDWKKKMDQENLNLQKQQLALAKGRGSGGGGRSSGRSGKSSGGKVNPYQLALDDILGSTDPIGTFNAKRGQYASVLSSGELQSVQAEAYARGAKIRNSRNAAKAQENTAYANSLKPKKGKANKSLPYDY